MLTAHPVEGVELYADGGAITGLLRDGDAALLINAASADLAAGLREAGVRDVEMVLFNHHRRDVADGLAGVLAQWSPRVIVPTAERELFEKPQAYWESEQTRWRLLCGHVPYHATHSVPISVNRGVESGDVIRWRRWEVRVLATPGYTDGSVTYLVRRDRSGQVLAFTGDLIWGPGQVRDVYSLQHEVTRSEHRVGDYHGFMGSAWTVLESLDRVLAQGPGHLIPAHGVVMDRPLDAVSLLRSRFVSAYQHYVNISALRWYFPEYFRAHSTESRTLPMQETFELPPNVRRIAGTTWALVANDGHALLIDPYCPQALDAAVAEVEAGSIVAYDAIWITHFHHDHVEAAESARQHFGIPVMTDRIMAEVIHYPERFFLTCLSPLACEVARPTEDGQTWRWRNYQLTAYHFPGQTYYHSGLHAVPDNGPSLFFAGDAVTPTGIDDYCSWNRNWLGEGIGFDRCLKLLRSLNPDMIFNQHVEVGFRFSADAYGLMLSNLRDREALFRAMMPWEHSNMGTDEYWVNTYPYEQESGPGDTVQVEVRVMNHLDRACPAVVTPILEAGWGAGATGLGALCEPGRESRFAFALTVPADAPPGRVVIPFRVRFDGVDFGSMREAIVCVGDDPAGEATARPMESQRKEAGHGDER